MTLLSSTSGAKNSQAEWFSSDLTGPANASGLAQVVIQITSSVGISYTTDSGTTWLPFNGGSALAADIPYYFNIPWDSSYLFNIRKTTATNVTVTTCEVHFPFARLSFEPPNPRVLVPLGATLYGNGTSGAQVGTANRVFCDPFYVPKACTVDKVSFEQTTAGGASTNFRMAIYNGSSLAPTTLVVESGNIAADGSNGQKDWTLSTPQALSQGYYFLALQTQDGTFAFRRYSSAILSYSDASGEQLTGCYFDNGSFGAFTSPVGSLTTSKQANVIATIRVSSW